MLRHCSITFAAEHRFGFRATELTGNIGAIEKIDWLIDQQDVFLVKISLSRVHIKAQGDEGKEEEEEEITKKGSIRGIKTELCSDG